MKQRCLNQKAKVYAYYGAKGITVCEEWKSFDQFYVDMGERPVLHSLDRIDNSKGYEPGNCRWVTWEVQLANRTVKGPPKGPKVTHCINGHEYTPENTYQRLDGQRHCRICTLKNGKAWRIRNNYKKVRYV